MKERKPLLASLKDTVVFFKNRDTVGRMKTEHSIFIPASIMKQNDKETEDFVKAARYINKRKEWFCPVEAEPVSVANISGIEFVFGFSPDTKFDDIIKYLDSKIQ